MEKHARKKHVSRWKVVLAWAVVLGSIVFWVALFLWDSSKREPDGPAPGLVFSVFMLVAGIFSLLAGVAGYLIVLYTNCFTSDFSRPMWDTVKVRIYLAQIFVPLLGMLGVGFMLSAILTPVLLGFGMSRSIAQMLPVLGCIGLLQILMVWFVIWAPLEKRVITKRLAAKGITETQMASGTFIGLSDPNRSSLKKLTCVEEDMGMLWFDPDQLIYWGDNEQFTIQREDLVGVERSMDAASTTALSGTAHVILRIRQPDGSERRIRLHREGIWTLSGKRSAMNELAEQIATWRSRTTPPPVPAQ